MTSNLFYLFRGCRNQCSMRRSFTYNALCIERRRVARASHTLLLWHHHSLHRYSPQEMSREFTWNPHLPGHWSSCIWHHRTHPCLCKIFKTNLKRSWWLWSCVILTLDFKLHFRYFFTWSYMQVPNSSSFIIIYFFIDTSMWYICLEFPRFFAVAWALNRNPSNMCLVPDENIYLLGPIIKVKII